MLWEHIPIYRDFVHCRELTHTPWYYVMVRIYHFFYDLEWKIRGTWLKRYLREIEVFEQNGAFWAKTEFYHFTSSHRNELEYNRYLILPFFSAYIYDEKNVLIAYGPRKHRKERWL